MKSLLWLLAVFAAAVALVILGRFDAGYALFVYPPYRVEVSMLFFGLAAVLSFVLLHALLRHRSEVARLKELNHYLSGYLPRQKSIERMKELGPKNGFGPKPAGL